MIEEISVPLPPQGSATGTSKRRRNIRVAVQGCSHGSLDRIYATLQAREGPPIDLLLCCGDFQAIRNAADLNTMAVPHKFREIGTFWRYYSGQCRAPIPTIFIGGNHEASAYLQELFYGGWVAPNIYYLGAAGVVRFGGLRIGGLSGIYKSHDFCKGHYEAPPYDRGTLRSVYHVRNVEVYRMKCLGGASATGTTDCRRPLDVFLSHDWPRGIEQHGDTAALMRKKPFFRQEIQQNNLGSAANEDVLNAIKPRLWFSAHLHVKFEATVHHIDADEKQGGVEKSSRARLIPSQVATAKEGTVADKEVARKDTRSSGERDEQTTTFVGLESSACSTERSNSDLTEQMTRFLSLDKCLPRRPHLQIVNISVRDDGSVDSGDADDSIDANDAIHRPLKIEYDVEWLAVLRRTHNLTQLTRSYVNVPNEAVVVTEEDIENVKARIIERHQHRPQKRGDARDDEAATSAMAIPENFCVTAPPHGSPGSDFAPNGGAMVGNPQTDELLDMLGLDHIVTVPHMPQILQPNDQPSHPPIVHLTQDDNEIDLDGDEGEIDEGGDQVDDNEIDLDDDDDDDDNDEAEEEEDVQTKKARTGSIEDIVGE